MPRLTAEQIEARRHGMGSTDVLEALGLAPWAGAGPMRVFLSKTRGDDLVDESAAELEWGHTLEPVLLDWYEITTGAHVLPGGHVPHPTEPWLWATLDGKVVGAPKNVECKVVGPGMSRHWSFASDEGIPRYVRAQVTIGMACTGAISCDVVATIGGQPPHIWTVGYDSELGGLLIEGGRRFWERTQRGEPPPIDGTPATRIYLASKYPRVEDPRIVEAPSDIDSLGIARAAASASERNAKRRKAELDARIMAAIGSADGMRGDGWQMTWKENKNGDRRQRFTDWTGDGHDNDDDR